MSEQARPPKLRLLVGVDLTEQSRIAFSRAVELARACGGSLTLMHVTSDLLPPKLVDAHDSYARDVLEEHVLKARAEGVSEVAQMIVYGRDYEQLIEQACKDQSDLIVVGRHRPASLVQDMLGTTVDRVLRLGGHSGARGAAQGRASLQLGSRRRRLLAGITPRAGAGGPLVSAGAHRGGDRLREPAALAARRRRRCPAIGGGDASTGA